MRKRYVSLFLAAVLSFGQIIGTGQLVHASGVSVGTELEREGEGSSVKRQALEEDAGIAVRQAPEEAGSAEQAPDMDLEEDAGIEMYQMPEETGTPTDADANPPAEGSTPGQTQAPGVDAEGGYSLQFYLGNERKMLSGSNWFISKTDNGQWYDSANENIVPMEITKVEVTKNSEVITVKSAEEGLGWYLSPQKTGEAEVAVTCEAVIDDIVSPDEAVKAIAPETRTIRVIVCEKDYRLEVVNKDSDPGNNNMLPGDSVTLAADVFEKSMVEDEWGGTLEEEKKVTDVELSWKAEADHESFQTVTGTGDTFTVQAPKDAKYYTIIVTVEGKKGGETVGASSYWLSVTNEYYIMELETSDGIENIWIGEEGTVTPVLYRYQEGQAARVKVEDAHYKFSFDDWESFQLWNGKTQVKEESGLQDSGAFTVKKLKNEYNGLRIDAYVGELLYSSKFINFLQNDYYEISIEGGHEGGSLFVDDEYPAENDEDTPFTLNTGKIRGEIEIEWSLVDFSLDPAIDISNASIFRISDDQKTITINPKALKDELAAKQGGTEGEWYSFSCELQASVKAGGEEQYRAQKYISIEKPSYDLDTGKEEMFSGAAITYVDAKMEGNVRNKNYPTGENVEMSIKDIKVEQDPENANVFTVKKEGNNILLCAENPGWANIVYQVAAPNGREFTFQVRKSVIKDKYECQVKSSTGTFYLLPNAKLKLEPEVRYGFYDTAAQMEVWEKLDSGKYTVTYMADGLEEICSVGADGTVQAKEACGECEITIQYKILQDGKEPLEYEEYAYISVRESYRQAVTKEIFVAPGETVNAVEWEWKEFDLEHPNGRTENGQLTYVLRKISDGIELNEERTGFTVDVNAPDGKQLWIGIILSKKDTNGKVEMLKGSVTLNICRHNFTKTEEKAATCTEAGSRTLECSKCRHASKTETIPAAGHKPGNLVTVKQAACTAAGTQEKKCTVCGKVVETKPIPAVGHTFGEWKEKTGATALKGGTQVRTCKTCSAQETRSTAKLKATIKLNVKKIPLQVKKSTTAVEVVSKTKGDSIKSWKSSNKKIATVTSKGKITGKKVGTAKITVTLRSGISASVTVKVQKKAVTTTKLAVTGKSVKKNKLTLKKGKSVTLAVTRTPVTSTEKITYQSSNKKVATVSGKGKIKAKKAGKANITVKSGKKKVVIKVTVKK